MTFGQQFKRPFLMVNFKAYDEAVGLNASKMARFAGAIASRHGISIAVAPAAPEIRETSRFCATFAQHIDPVDAGARTGFITAEAVRAAGAIGTLVNHAEHQLNYNDIAKCVAAAKSKGLVTVVCADSPETAANVAKLNPDYVAYEPPELIGSGRSVSKTKPDALKAVIDALGRMNVSTVCGAGVSSADDVGIALSLGAAGVLVSSAVVKAPRPENVIEELAAGFKK